MRILVVQDANWTKKGPHQQHHLMEMLSIKGHEILVIGYDQLWRSENGGLVSKRWKLDNISRFYPDSNVNFICPKFIRIPFLDYISFLISSRSEIKRYIDEFNPDIVIGFTSIISNYWGAKFANERGIPFLYYWTDVIHTLIPFKPFREIAKLAERKIIKQSTKVMVINEVLKDFVIHYGANPSTTQVLPGGVDFKRFNPHMDSSKKRRMFGLLEDDYAVLFMGWIYPFSGLKEVISELARYKDLYPNLKLLIVGEGDYYKELKDLANLSNLGDRIIFTGWRPYTEIPELIASSDICILPAYNNEVMRDIVPIKIYEYLAMGKPVISTKLPGVIKEFGHNSGVIYVEKSEDVLRKISDLTYKDLEVNRKNANSFISGYDWSTIVTNFEVILQSLVNENTNNPLKTYGD